MLLLAQRILAKENDSFLAIARICFVDNCITANLFLPNKDRGNT